MSSTYVNLVQTFDYMNEDGNSLHIDPLSDQLSVCYYGQDLISTSYLFMKDFSKHTTHILFHKGTSKDTAEKIYASHAYMRHIGIPLFCNRDDLFEEYYEHVDKMQELKAKEFKLKSKLQKNKAKQEAIMNFIKESKNEQ